MATARHHLPAVRTEVVTGDVVDQEKALAANEQIKEALREGKTALWKLAEGFYNFNESHGWAALGYKDVTAWLADPDIDTTRGTYYRLVRTWQKLAVEKGISRAQLEGVEMSKAALVADDVAAGDVRPSTALKDVKQLPASKLRQKYGKPLRGRPKKEAQTGHAPTTALKAAAELPWEWVEQALSGRAPLALREARLREALQQFLSWRAEYLAS